MKVNTILNNNALLVTLEDGSEAIVRGKGLGFTFKKNDAIYNQDFEHLYVLASNEEKSQYGELIDNIAEENIQLAEEIISFASKKLNISFPLTAVVGLADHISFLWRDSKKVWLFKTRSVSLFLKFIQLSMKLGNMAFI